MAVVTVFRWPGSGGRHVAEKVAAGLGYQFSDYKVVESILREYGLARFPDVYGSTPDVWEFFTRRGQDRNEVNAMIRAATLAEARHGNVVMLGRGCFLALQGFDDVLNVHVMAPFAVRVARIMDRLGITEKQATKFVKERDAMVAGFIRAAYSRGGHDTRSFDLVIDTGKVDQDAAVRWVTEAAKGLETRSRGPASTAAIQVDPLLAETVAKALRTV